VIAQRAKDGVKSVLARSPRAYKAARRGRIVARYFARRPHEADFKFFRRYPHATGLFLDVGGNSGQSALSFRTFQRSAPILSVEPNPFHRGDLEFVRRIIPRFDFMICAAGEESGSLTLHVPVHRGIPLTGEASLRPIGPEQVHSLDLDSRPGDLEIAEETVAVRRLDELNVAPQFVKIDVEGFELPVVRGLEQTIRTHRPILLVETSQRFGELLELVGPWGYRPYVYEPSTDTLSEFGGVGQNVFLMPDEGAQDKR
jgi:FkbM family methyltransferase